MSAESKLAALAEHYDTTDISAELDDATSPPGPEAPAATDRMTTFAVRLPVVVLERARELAGQSDLTTSALIRRWIDAGIAEDSTDSADRVVPVEALLELIGRAPREPIER